MISPPVPPIRPSRPGERSSYCLAEAAATAQILSRTRAISGNKAPSSSICSGRCPAPRLVNSGSTTTKNTMVFGFIAPTTNPSRTARPAGTGLDPAARASATHRRCRYAEIAQVAGADPFDHGEDGRRPLDERADAERYRHHLHVQPDLIACHGEQRGSSAYRKRPADREQHARAGDSDQHGRQRGEREHVTGWQHGHTIERLASTSAVIFPASTAPVSQLPDRRCLSDRLEVCQQEKGSMTMMARRNRPGEDPSSPPVGTALDTVLS